LVYTLYLSPVALFCILLFFIQVTGNFASAPSGRIRFTGKAFSDIKRIYSGIKAACILQMKQTSHIEGDVYMPNCRAVGKKNCNKS